MFDGELILGEGCRRTSTHSVHGRMMMRRPTKSVMFVAFDVLELDGETTMNQPYTHGGRCLRNFSRGFVLDAHAVIRGRPRRRVRGGRGLRGHRGEALLETLPGGCPFGRLGEGEGSGVA